MKFKKVVAYKFINDNPLKEKILFEKSDISLCTNNENSATGDNELWICDDMANVIHLKLFNYKVVGIYANIIRFLAYSKKGEKVFVSAF